MKTVEQSFPYVILVSLLLMNILLVSGMMHLFFDWDTTLLAGVIAFIGAILGGTITLAGVNMSINENRKHERLGEIKKDLKFIEELSDKVYELINRTRETDKLTYVQKVELLGSLRNKLASLANSPEVFVLGDRVNKKIDDLGKMIITYELAVMVKREIEENPFEEIQFEIISCFGVFEKKREELRGEYKQLQAL